MFFFFLLLFDVLEILVHLATACGGVMHGEYGVISPIFLLFSSGFSYFYISSMDDRRFNVISVKVRTRKG